MDPRLLRLYNEELTHLREVGAEFAHEFPKIAARLSMDGLEVADPYVERLLEGFAFMAARMQLKLEARVPAVHRPPARNAVPELPRAGAVDDGGAPACRPRQPRPGARPARCRAAPR